MVILSEILEKTAREQEKYKPITVEKHLELEYDVGSLLVEDHNELNSTKFREDPNDFFLNLTRDNTQLLLNKIFELPTERVEEALMAKLPPPKTVLPRMKPVPRPKPLTKWQKFAKDKGIQKKKKAKLSWDDQLQQWIPLYGFKKAKAEKDKNWVVEVPQNADPNEDQFQKKIVAKSENMAKNELQRLRNIAKSKKIKVPRVGVANPEIASAKDLQAAVTVAKASTASLGKFQEKIAKEKDARGVAAITPGASRKRKMPPVSGDVEKIENMNIVDSILNKKPKLDLEKVVSKQIQNTRIGTGETQNRANKSKAGKKPKSGKGQRMGGKQGGGRKRR